MITKQNLIDALQKMEERGITHGYNSTTDMFRMFIAYLPDEKIESKKPAWEEQINEWFKPRMNWPQNSFMSGETMITLDGKDARWVLKDFIRTEIIEKICEEIKKATMINYDHESDVFESIVDKIKARWLKEE